MTRPLHRWLRRGLLLTLVTFSASGCTASTLPQAEHPLAGLWFREPLHQPPVPDDFTDFYLQIADGQVTGQGEWGNPPGLHGSLTVAGTVVGRAVTLDIQYASTDPTFAPIPSDHFEGTLDFPDRLRGTVTRSGTTFAVVYDKARPID